MAPNLTEEEKKELEVALAELKASIAEAKPKILKLKEMIKNKQPLTQEQREVMLKFKRSMDLIQAMKDRDLI